MKNEPVCSVCTIPCWLPLLKMMKPLCNFGEGGKKGKGLQMEMCSNEQVAKTQRSLLAVVHDEKKEKKEQTVGSLTNGRVITRMIHG